jgi:hypothetical protein
MTKIFSDATSKSLYEAFQPVKMGRIANAYQPSSSSSAGKLFAAFVVIFVITMLTHHIFRGRNIYSAINSFGSQQRGKRIKAITWNIAAINNNPFEYWITNDYGPYNSIMANVSLFIENPGINDVPVKDIFTEDMFADLEKSMRAAGWTGIEETRSQWQSEYRDRRIITQFLKDSILGKKRLASMPDRYTNTINTADGDVVMRPTVINCYSGDLSSIESWWKQWREFMFVKDVTMNKNGTNEKIKVSSMISKIKKSKYPAITLEEEKISIPLQTLCVAIFDAILVYMMNTIDKQSWQPLREDICNKLNRRKHDRTIEILEKMYADADIQFLQEVASSFAKSVKQRNGKLSSLFELYYPESMDSDRDQNSFILLKKGRYRDVREVTDDVLKEFDEMKNTMNVSITVPIAKGDLLALTATDTLDGMKYLFASFHGDTNGLATIPVVTAVHAYAYSKRPDHKLLFGMDANTYAHPDADQQGVLEFAKFYTSMNLNTCYGPHPNPLNFTTFHARTHLQPQLNKAVKLDEQKIKGDKNPKDFILFFASDFRVISTQKDNTGEGKYIENMVFPTLTFPSDHGITSTVLIEEPTAKASTSSTPAHSATESSRVASGTPSASASAPTSTSTSTSTVTPASTASSSVAKLTRPPNNEASGTKSTATSGLRGN